IRTIGAGIHEDLEIRNYSLQPVQFDLEIALRSDFADIFEVRRHTYVRRGEVITDWRPEDAALFTSYTNRDFQRRFAYRLNNIEDPPHFANGRITIPVSIAAGDTWRACGEFLFGEEDDVFDRVPQRDCRRDKDEQQLDLMQRQWRAQATRLT